MNLFKSKYDSIEEYDFKEITNRYDLNDSIVALIFRNQKELRILSRINLDGEVILQNKTFSKMNLNDDETIKSIIKNLKLIYEDFWKIRNQINTSIRLTLNIKVDNTKNSQIMNLEKNLNEIDLIYDFSISKFDKNFTYYRIIFNGTPDIFLKKMSDKNYEFNTQNKIWTLK